MSRELPHAQRGKLLDSPLVCDPEGAVVINEQSEMWADLGKEVEKGKPHN